MKKFYNMFLVIFIIFILVPGMQICGCRWEQCGRDITQCITLSPVLRAAVLPAQYKNNRDEVAYPVYVNDSVVLNYYLYYADVHKNVHKISLDDVTDENKQNATFIIYCNGQGVFSCDEDSGTKPYATTLLYDMPEHEREKTYILRFTYRGTGGSSGAFRKIYDLCEDTHAVFSLLHDEHNIPAEHIVLHGHSLGGSIATQVAAELHNTIPQKPCFVRSDRSFAYMEGVAADHIVPYKWHIINKATRALIRNVLNMSNLYVNVYHAWKLIPDRYKDFRVASRDEIIPQSASLYQAVSESEGYYFTDKIISGKHNDAQFIPQAWYSDSN